MNVLGWIWFAIVQLVALAFTVVGWLLLIPFAWSRAWVVRRSRVADFDGRQVTAWRGGWLTWPWGNEEDGVTGADFYRERFKDERRCAYLWSAWRNPANNLRFVFRWRGGPFKRWEWTWTLRGASHPLYFQLGWYPNGYPVLSGGKR